MSAPDLSNIFSAKIITILFWLMVMGSLTLFFNGYIQQRDNPNQSLAVTDLAGEEVVLQRNRAGHYIAPGQINGHPVTFLLDTGATDVSVPGPVAQAAELKEGRRSMVSTANGVVAVYQTELDTVQLGGITLNNIRANINPHMHDDVVLLGMSFMKHLDIIQREGTLTLKIPD
ncbi:retropepsin-like aspartic protease family protein [Methylophaga sp. OBS4]|uniref:retropepsin-like aspartic protease family protein n=1 Tax=Methylophaga sp. OBS4 TaxID=2991935 RepID=UPI002259E0E6|nr:retropepsin-like aspartic protease [Methylophaga sp. OBS4]MCX4187845.1 retroviral-like aspartic protease family protein [Methylophaga sp. OBS4]